MDIKHSNRAAIAIAEKHNISIDEAVNKLNKSSIWLIADETIRNSFSKQLSFLTVLNIAQRVFLGGIHCVVPFGVKNLMSIKSSKYYNLIREFGGNVEDNSSQKEDVKILFGIPCYDKNCIEVVSSGWQGGVNFFNQERILFPDNNISISLGSIAAASLSCYFAFCKIYDLENPEITINTGISLWNLEAGNEWYEVKNEGPQNVYMPRNIWALGLGHLGQAYLWTIGMMHCSHPDEIQFLLQDNDIVESENIGSQVLSFYHHIGYPKTRACLNFLERIGFKTQIIEKPFVEGDDRQDFMNQYQFLLNGVDNVKTRKSINNDSFKLFLDGATNGKFSLFDSFTLKNISKYKKPVDEIWPENDSQEQILHKNLYARYEKEHKCGIMYNIGISTPFVGLFASTIIVAELLRSLNQGKSYKIVSLQMRDLFDLTAICDGLYNNELLRFAI